MIKTEQIVAGMVLGSLVGGLGGLLLAPQRGRESREVLQDKLGQIKNRFRRNHTASGDELPEALASRDADYLH